MTAFNRPEHYEFRVSRPDLREPEIVICAMPLKVKNCGSIHFWIETRHKETYEYDANDDLVVKLPRIERLDGGWVYGNNLLQKRTKNGNISNQNYFFFLILEGLAAGEVTGRAADSFIFLILNHFFIQKNAQWLREGAPEWWELVKPDRKSKASA